MEKCYKVSFTAYLQKISLALKSSSFQLQVYWKRGQKIAESGKVPLSNGCSVFGKNLTITCNMIYDTQKKIFKQKITKFQVILYKGQQTRQAGQVQFNVAQYMNQRQLQSKQYEVPLKNCPDKNSKMFFSLKGILDGQISADQRSLASMNSVAVTQVNSPMDLGSKIFRRDSQISKASKISQVSVKKQSQLIPTSDKQKKSAHKKNKEDKQSQNFSQRQQKNPIDVKIKALQIQNNKIRQQLRQKDKLIKENEQLKFQIKKQQFSKVTELKLKIDKGKKQLEQLKVELKGKPALQKQIANIEKQIFLSKFQLMTAFNLGFQKGGSSLANKLQDLCGYYQNQK